MTRLTNSCLMRATASIGRPEKSAESAHFHSTRRHAVCSDKITHIAAAASYGYEPLSDVARTVLIVTNDLDFSGQVSDLMLRAGVQTICFAQFANALQLTQILAPDLVLIHAPREHSAAGWACYQMIQSDATLGSAVALISMPASAPLERAV